MKVEQIWRYPVKSMGGERLNRVRIGALGLEGDRVVHVEDESRHVITSRTHHRLLGHHATLNTSGEPLVDGSLWSDPKIREAVVDIVGLGATLVRDESIDRFDVLPLLVATDGAIAAFGHDGRRLRPNLVIGGVEGLAERDWPGQCLHIGDVVIGIQDLRGRCIMTTFDPDSLKQDRQVLKEIAQKFGGTLALNCYVIQGGEIRVGDAVVLVSKRGCETIHG
ncbi:MAG: MOSC domain-containing protein [Nitrospira sp. CG24E]|nr:MAG: MOSC domain-containing protein [Nitrospira sp. CG24E]